MSAPLRSFEGPDVQRLLDQIRAELGPGAKIDGAEKTRVGGVLGFFAKEHYRVVVAVPAVSDDATPTATADGAHTEAAVTAMTGGRPLAPDVFTALAEATDDVNAVGSPVPVLAPATPVPSAAVAVESPVSESFDTVLTRVATSLDAGLSGSAPWGPDPVVGDNGTDIAARASEFLSRSTPTSPPEATPPPWAVAPAVAVLPGAPVVPKTAVAPVPRPAPAPSAAVDPVTAALRRAGLGQAVMGPLAEGLARGERLEALLFDAFAALAVPGVPRSVGSLLAVVGSGVPAHRLAQGLAQEMGSDSAEVPVVSRHENAHRLATGRLLVRFAEDAAERAPGWRRSAPVVVVVEAPLAGGDRGFATAVLRALRPTAVWGVVEASHKAEDMAAWAEDLGGLDALALENTDATVSPAAVLATAVAVARLDGQPATAARWVATVMDRVDRCR